MGEDISQVSPTLGFNIKTLFYKGYSLHICKAASLPEGLHNREGFSSRTFCEDWLRYDTDRHFARHYELSGDVGGQKSLRPFWRNHFEETDAMIWVVDSNDRLRIEDCKIELFSILQEEVSLFFAQYIVF